jgi:hypothetical protein
MEEPETRPATIPQGSSAGGCRGLAHCSLPQPGEARRPGEVATTRSGVDGAAPRGVVGNQGVIPGGGWLPAVMPVAAVSVSHVGLRAAIDASER